MVWVRWRHQRGNAINQLQWREGDLIGLCPALVVGEAAGLAVLFGAAVGQLAAPFVQQLTRKRRRAHWRNRRSRPVRSCGAVHALAMRRMTLAWRCSGPLKS